jgi:hypothetical protein
MLVDPAEQVAPVIGHEDSTCTSGLGSSSATSARSASMPSPVRADTTTECFWVRSEPVDDLGVGDVGLVDDDDLGDVPGPLDTRRARLADRGDLALGVGVEPSTTCSSRSASATSSSVLRKASTSWWGSARTKPTVSTRVYSRPSGVSARRTVGSRVANSWFSTSTPAPVSRLSRSRTCRRWCSRRSPRWARPVRTAARVSLGVPAGLHRGDVALELGDPGVDPAPVQLDLGLAGAARPDALTAGDPPPAWRLIDSPQPRRRGSRYCNWASSTCALPSRLLACWAKMSRISAVRSMTLTLTTSSRARR